MAHWLTIVEPRGIVPAGEPFVGTCGGLGMGAGSSRREFMLSAAGLAITAGLRPSGALAQGPGTLTVAWDTDIDSLDPHVFKSIGGYGVQCNIYDPLLNWKVRPIDGMPGVSRAFPGEFEGS